MSSQITLDDITSLEADTDVPALIFPLTGEYEAPVVFAEEAVELVADALDKLGINYISSELVISTVKDSKDENTIWVVIQER